MIKGPKTHLKMTFVGSLVSDLAYVAKRDPKIAPVGYFDFGIGEDNDIEGNQLPEVVYIAEELLKTLPKDSEDRDIRYPHSRAYIAADMLFVL